MTDDLVEKLRILWDRASFEPHMHHVAADEITRLRAELAAMGRENNRLKYGPEDFGGRMTQEVIADLREQLTAIAAEARRKALEEAVKVAEGMIAEAKDWDSSYWDLGCESVAHVIRDLINTAHVEEPPQ